MPGHTCIVCGNNSILDPSVSFHRFPRNPDKRGRWLSVFGMDESRLRCQSRVCSWHFPDGDVKRDPLANLGRPRVKPPKERQEWHYHLGGMRHCRVPLSADLKEVLEVAYISKIMAKNFRKEGQPEKERIARITGMSLDKVQEWFKNRRKKDRLQKDRDTPRKRGRRSTTSSCGESVSEQTLNSSPGMEPMHVAMVMNPSVQVSQLVHTEVNTSSLAANTQTISNASMQ